MKDEADLSQIENETWTRLVRAKGDRRSALRWFVLATSDSQSRPQQRTVVLRDVDRVHRTMTIFTDRRSPKVMELAANPAISALFFDPKAMIQMRFSGEGQVLGRKDSDVYFPKRAVQDYASVHAPGTHLPSPGIDYDEAIAAENFCAIQLRFTHLDWLQLAREGHRRARFVWSQGKCQSSWLAP